MLPVKNREELDIFLPRKFFGQMCLFLSHSETLKRAHQPCDSSLSLSGESLACASMGLCLIRAAAGHMKDTGKPICRTGQLVTRANAAPVTCQPLIKSGHPRHPLKYWNRCIKFSKPFCHTPVIHKQSKAVKGFLEHQSSCA